jgi:hypothetical protein
MNENLISERLVIVNKLLAKVHLFFPVGLPALGRRYKGWTKYNEIVLKKNDELLSESETDYTRFLQKIREYPGSYRTLLVDNESPSYIIQIQLPNNSNPKIRNEQYLYIGISLLAEIYTLYFLDYYVYEFLEGGFVPPSTSIVYYQTAMKDENLRHLTQIIHDNAKVYFPNHEFIEHDILFSYKLKGSHLYQEGFDDPNPEYTLFDHLIHGRKDVVEKTVIK